MSGEKVVILTEASQRVEATLVMQYALELTDDEGNSRVAHVVMTVAEEPIGNAPNALGSLMAVIGAAAEKAQETEHRGREVLIGSAARYDIGGDE
jgi:hypothetical protein